MGIVNGYNIVDASGDEGVADEDKFPFNVEIPNTGEIPMGIMQYSVSNTGGDPDIQFKLQGKLHADADYEDLKVQDHSTSTNVDTAGSDVSGYKYVELMPYMQVYVHEVTETGAGFAFRVDVMANKRLAG